MTRTGYRNLAIFTSIISSVASVGTVTATNSGNFGFMFWAFVLALAFLFLTSVFLGLRRRKA